MSRHSTEEWDRRKRYLLRSLFDDIPLLSPTPEVQELSSQLTRLENDIHRPYSPLPELITEKEPNRHDDSKEYYEALREKVVTVYKKLFLYKRLASVEEEEVHSDEVFEQKNQEADSCHQSELLDQPEIIRSENTTNKTKDSINALDHESDNSAEDDFIKEIEIAEDFSLNLTGNVYTSTPTAEIEELQSNQLSRRRTLQTIPSDEIILSPKRLKSENLATQTSFNSSCENNSWQEIKTAFFVGKQSVFNLCRCRNHICH